MESHRGAELLCPSLLLVRMSSRRMLRGPIVPLLVRLNTTITTSRCRKCFDFLRSQDLENGEEDEVS